MTLKQEQESAGEEVKEVAPNVLRMQLDVRIPGLGHVNCYALMDDEGAAIVDPGMPGAETHRILTQRLKQAGLAIIHRRRKYDYEGKKNLVRMSPCDCSCNGQPRPGRKLCFSEG